MKFADHLQMCCLSGRTGSLSTSCNGSRGEVFMVGGRVVHASLRGSEGEAALYEMLQFPGDSSHFEDGAMPPRQSVTHTLEHILLEAARRSDEKLMQAEETPAPIPESSGASVPVAPWGILISLSDPTARPFVLNRTVMTLGRDLSSDICILVPSVSKNHCRIEYEDGRIVLTDLNSSNGTFINGVQIRQSEVHFGEMLQAGASFLRLDPPGAVSYPVSEDASRHTTTLEIPPLRSRSQMSVIRKPQA
jgi:hypothetical protein